MIQWDIKNRSPRLGDFVISSARRLNKNTTAIVISEIKARMLAEPDEYKRQCWAEVGIEMNRIFMRLYGSQLITSGR